MKLNTNLIASYVLDTLTHPGVTLAIGLGLGIAATVLVLVGC